MQTEAPIYYKLGDNQRVLEIEPDKIVTSHVDMFPTVLDYLLGEKPFFDLFHGESLFKKERFPYVVSGRFNGPRNPREFFIHDGKHKFTLRFESSTKLEVLHFKDAKDRSLEMKDRDLRPFYQPAFKRLFN